MLYLHDTVISICEVFHGVFRYANRTRELLTLEALSMTAEAVDSPSRPHDLRKMVISFEIHAKIDCTSWFKYWTSARMT